MDTSQLAKPRLRTYAFLRNATLVCFGVSFISYFLYTYAAELFFVSALACGLGATISYFRIPKSERAVVQEAPQIAGNEVTNSMDSNTKWKLFIAVALPLIGMLLTFFIAPRVIPYPHPYDQRLYVAAVKVGYYFAVPSVIFCVINFFISISLLKKTNVGTYLIVYTLLCGGLIWLAIIGIASSLG